MKNYVTPSYVRKLAMLGGEFKWFDSSPMLASF